MKKDINTFIQQSGKLPSLPSIYSELTEATKSDNCSVDDVSQIIRRDQSLASRLLRLANSAFYSFPTPIGTLEEAVQIIGLRQIQELALATSVIKAFSKIPSHLVDVTSFWEHSIACGLASAMLAEHQHDPAPERFFVGGLLHDTGRLVLYLNAPDSCQEILRRCEEEEQLPCRIEREVLGFDHAMLGGELMSAWKLPQSLAEMVGCHHNMRGGVLGFADPFIVHYADFIVSALEFGNSGERLLSPLVIPQECRRLLIEDEIPSLVEELKKKCEDVFPILSSSDHD